MHFKEICYELEKFILGRGYVPLRGYCGHGIGKRPHEEPEIPNYLEGHNSKAGPKDKRRNGFLYRADDLPKRRHASFGER